MPRLTLERLAQPVEDWVADAKCLQAGVDMMDATEEEVKRICGPCIVREQCDEGAVRGAPVRAGTRGGTWRSKRERQRL